MLAGVTLGDRLAKSSVVGALDGRVEEEAQDAQADPADLVAESALEVRVEISGVEGLGDCVC